MVDGLTITVRDRWGARVGVIDDYAQLQLVERHLAVGSWVLDLPLDHALAPVLASPGSGVIVEIGSHTFSGPVSTRSVVIEGDTRMLTVSGPDDLTVLADRVTSPEPATPAPPFSTSVAWSLTGPAETVIKALVNLNAGPGALPPRRRLRMVIAPDLARGISIVGRTRWHDLMTDIRDWCVLAGLGIRCVDHGPAGIVFDVFVPTDRSTTVEFSEILGTVAKLEWAADRPAATHAVVGGQGEGTARTIVMSSQEQAIADGWERREVFVDRRDTDVAAELVQAGQLALIGDGSTSRDQTGVVVTPIDGPGASWPTDYGVGDLVAWIDPFGDRWAHAVTAVAVLANGDGIAAVPTLGAIGPTQPSQWSRLQALARRASVLETR
jgi:hypothetical protein